MNIVHVAFKHLQPRPFRTKVAPLVVVMAHEAWILRVLLGLCIIIPWAGPLLYLRFRLSTWSAQSVVG
jgi:hypothetical protein